MASGIPYPDPYFDERGKQDIGEPSVRHPADPGPEWSARWAPPPRGWAMPAFVRKPHYWVRTGNAPTDGWKSLCGAWEVDPPDIDLRRPHIELSPCSKCHERYMAKGGDSWES